MISDSYANYLRRTNDYHDLNAWALDLARRGFSSHEGLANARAKHLQTAGHPFDVRQYPASWYLTQAHICELLIEDTLYDDEIPL